MLRPGQGLALLTLALLLFGVIMVNSAGLSVAPEHAVSWKDILLGRPMILAGLSLIALFVGSLVPVRAMYQARGVASPVPWLVVLSIGLLLIVHVPGFGKEVNGATRWMNVGPLSFQPSEIAKWSVLIMLAWYAARRASDMHRLFIGFIPPMILVGIICALIALEDLGTATLIGAVAVLVLIAAGARMWHGALLVPIGLLGFIAAIIQAPYRLDRLRAFLDPYQDPQGIGYHMIQSMAAVSSGGLAGRGLGNGIQKFGYLPEDTTDFIFAIICEELGVVGVIMVIALYTALLSCGLAVMRRLTRPFEQLLALGVLMTVGFQALINLAVVTGVGPTKGIALPLLSSGGTGWILTAFCIGLLVAMERDAVREERDTKRMVREAHAARAVSATEREMLLGAAS